MSDQLNTPATDTIDEATLDPKVVEYFNNKFAPVVKKKDELLSSIGTLNSLKKELEGLGGIDAIKSLKEQADAAAAAAEQARLEKLSKEGKLTEVEEHYKKLLQEKDGKLTSFQQKLLNKEVESTLASAIGEEGNALLLMPHIRGRVEASFNDEGEVVVTVKGAAGQMLNADGKPLTVQDLVAEFKANPMFAGAFKAPQVNGGGSRSANAAQGGDNPFAAATMNVTKQMELIRSKPEVARALAKSAGVLVDW